LQILEDQDNAGGMSKGAEKKAKNGQIYNICARWSVATWLDLSPVSPLVLGDNEAIHT
jgi:hypothetical protein